MLTHKMFAQKAITAGANLWLNAICAATGSRFSPFALETTGGHGASTATEYFLFAKQLHDSGLPADVLVGKLKKDAQHAVEDELLVLNRRAGGLGSRESLLFFLLRLR
jgi:hypothetical protein